MFPKLVFAGHPSKSVSLKAKKKLLQLALCILSGIANRELRIFSDINIEFCGAVVKDYDAPHFAQDIANQINIARKCGMVYFLSAIPMFPPINLNAMEGSK